MSARTRQAMNRGQPFLFGCLAALSLPMGNYGAETPATNDVDRLKPYQAVSTNTPPASPEIFNPDANAPQLPEPPPTDFRWTRQVIVSTNSTPKPQFNPDPGASLRPVSNAPAALFHEPIAPPVFTPPAIPAENPLPRKRVRLGENFPPANPPPRSYGSEPLTNGLALPR